MCPPQDPQSLQGVAPHTQVSPGTDILPLSHLSGPLMASPYRTVASPGSGRAELARGQRPPKWEKVDWKREEG